MLLSTLFLCFVALFGRVLCASLQFDKNKPSAVLISNGGHHEEFLKEIELDCDYTESFYVVDFYFNLKPDAVPKLLAELLQEEQNLKMELLFNLTKIERTTFEEYNDLKNLLGIDLFDFKMIFEKLNVSFVEIFEDSHINSIVLSKLVNLFKINLKELLASKGNDEKIKELILNGNFEEETFDEALKVLGVTNEDFYYFIKPYVLYQLSNLNLFQFKNLDEDFKILAENLEKVFDFYFVTFIDVTSYEQLNKVLQKYYVKLNHQKISGIFVDETKVFTSSLINENWKNIKEYANIFGITLDKCFLYTMVDVNYINSHVVELTTSKVNFNFVPHKLIEGDLEDCKYVTEINGSAAINSFPIVLHENNHLSATKTPSTVFKIGGPLICDRNLYGIAEMHNVEEIIFATLEPDKIYFSEAVKTQLNLLNVLITCFIFILV